MEIKFDKVVAVIASWKDILAKAQAIIYSVLLIITTITGFLYKNAIVNLKKEKVVVKAQQKIIANTKPRIVYKREIQYRTQYENIVTTQVITKEVAKIEYRDRVVFREPEIEMDSQPIQITETIEYNDDASKYLNEIGQKKKVTVIGGFNFNNKLALGGAAFDILEVGNVDVGLGFMAGKGNGSVITTAKW